MSDLNSSLINEFLIESFENLSNISDELTQYEKEPENSELLNSVYRKVHTLKGSASFIGFKKLQEITHIGETLLDRLREGELHLNGDITDVLLDCFDICVEILKAIEANGVEPDKDYSAIKSALQKFLDAESQDSPGEVGSDDVVVASQNSTTEESIQEPVSESVKDPAPTKKKVLKKVLKKKLVKKVKKIKPSDSPTSEKVEAAESKALENKTTDDTSVKSEAPAIPVEKAPVVKKSTPPSTAKKATSKTGRGSTASVADSVVRVNVQLLDKIMNVVGELVLNRNQILQSVNGIDNSELSRLAQQLNIITTELQTDIMQTRMQPVGAVVNKFERVVRDLARSQNKKISLVISGQETELDKTLLEAIRDPLTHLIRNSVDHGIESPEDRKNSGKDETGNIQIKSYHEGGQVNIEIVDDGKGIDPKIIAAKAIEKNIVTQEEIALMSERQIINLIFSPGFSTAEQVTNISGRGVGMDVVKNNIEKIGGTVDIDSKVGHGSVFRLKIPLTLAIIPALIVKSAGESFAIPQLNLVELVRIEAEKIDTALEKIHGNDFFRLRGDLIPVFNLSSSLNLESVAERSEKLFEVYRNSNKLEKISKREVVDELIEEDCMNLVVLKAEGVSFALVVDVVLDTEEIVVKPLSQKLREKTCFAGATIMGDGSVALILDALGFYNRVAHTSATHQTEKDTLAGKELSMESFADDDQEVLLLELFDDRVYGIPLILVNRLEKFNASRIEWTGKQPIIKYGNVSMPLINVEKSLGYDSYPDFAQLDPEQTISCIVVKLKGHFYGVLVKSIVDIAISEGNICSDSVSNDCLLGTVFIGEKTITLLDIHHILGQLQLGTTKNIVSNSENQKRILLVEDSPLYRKIESEFLIESGYDVVTANDGAEALVVLDNDPRFDIIITDIEMPVMNGFEFCRELRQREGFANIPVLAVSTKVQDKDFEMGREVGFNEHLEKLNKEEVLGKIQAYIRGC